ncbi:hypothetical protein, partial [Escherichia coli]
AFSSGAGRTSDGNGSHASTLKSPSYTKSVSWQHYLKSGENITSALKLNSHNRLPGIYNPKDIVSILIGSYQSQSL